MVENSFHVELSYMHFPSKHYSYLRILGSSLRVVQRLTENMKINITFSFQKKKIVIFTKLHLTINKFSVGLQKRKFLLAAMQSG